MPLPGQWPPPVPPRAPRSESPESVFSVAALLLRATLGDDVEAEFEAAKAADVAAELPHIEEPSALPGWGAWSGQQRDSKWLDAAKAKVQQ